MDKEVWHGFREFDAGQVEKFSRSEWSTRMARDDMFLVQPGRYRMLLSSLRLPTTTDGDESGVDTCYDTRSGESVRLIAWAYEGLEDAPNGGGVVRYFEETLVRYEPIKWTFQTTSLIKILLIRMRRRALERMYAPDGIMAKKCAESFRAKRARLSR